MRAVRGSRRYSARVLYRLAHAVNASYGLVIAWGYILLFALALSLLFVFPQMSLLLFFLGLASLAVTITLGWLIDGITRAMARRALSAGRCPRCRETLPAMLEPDEACLCGSCHSQFQAGGAELDERERARYVDTPPDEAVSGS